MGNVIKCPGCGAAMKVSKPQFFVDDKTEEHYYICSYDCPTPGCWLAPLGKGETPEEALQNAYDKAARRAGACERS